MCIVFLGVFKYIITYSIGMMVGQDIWQRYFTAKDTKVARTGGVLVGVFYLVFSLAMVLIGMSALIVLPNINSTQDIFTMIAFETLPRGFLGIVFAAVAAAIMSTASGKLLSFSTIITKDILKDHFFQHITDKQFIKLSRITTLVLGVLAIIISLWIQELLVAIDVAYALLAGSIFIPIIFGLFWKRTTAKAAFYAMAASAFVVIGGLVVEGLSSTNPILYGIIVNIVVIIIVSLFDKSSDKSVKSKVV